MKMVHLYDKHDELPTNGDFPMLICQSGTVFGLATNSWNVGNF